MTTMGRIALAALIVALISFAAALAVATHADWHIDQDGDIIRLTPPALSPLTLPSSAAPTCTLTTDYLPDGTRMVCTTCCSGALCTTNCI